MLIQNGCSDNGLLPRFFGSGSTTVGIQNTHFRRPIVEARAFSTPNQIPNTGDDFYAMRIGALDNGGGLAGGPRSAIPVRGTEYLQFRRRV